MCLGLLLGARLAAFPLIFTALRLYAGNSGVIDHGFDCLDVCRVWPVRHLLKYTEQGMFGLNRGFGYTEFKLLIIA